MSSGFVRSQLWGLAVAGLLALLAPFQHDSEQKPDSKPAEATAGKKDSSATGGTQAARGGSETATAQNKDKVKDSDKNKNTNTNPDPPPETVKDANPAAIAAGAGTEFAKQPDAPPPQPIDNKVMDVVIKMIEDEPFISGGDLLKALADDQDTKLFATLLAELAGVQGRRLSVDDIRALAAVFPLDSDVRTFEKRVRLRLPGKNTLATSPDHGNSFSFGHDVVSSRVTYRGLTVPVLYLNTFGGSRLAFLPPVGLADDLENSVAVTDAVTFRPLHDPATGCSLTAHDVAESHAIDDETKVLLSMSLRFVNEEDLRQTVRASARKQLARKVEVPMIPGEATAVDLERPNDVAIAHVDAIRIVAADPGCEKIDPVYITNPVLGERLRVSMVVPKRLVTLMFAQGGANFEVQYIFPAFRQHLTEVHATDVLLRTAKIVLNEEGVSIANTSTSVNGGSVQILVDRKKFLDRMTHQSQRGMMRVQGNSPERISFLIGNLQERLNQIPRASNSEITQFLQQTLGWEKTLSQPSVVEAIGAIQQGKVVTAEQNRQLNVAMGQIVKNSGASGSLGVILPNGLNLGSSATGKKSNHNQWTDVDFGDKQKAQAIQEFHNNIVSGTIVIPPDLDLALVAEQDLNEQCLEVALLAEPGVVDSYQVKMRFNSAEPLPAKTTASRAGVSSIPSATN